MPIHYHAHDIRTTVYFVRIATMSSYANSCSREHVFTWTPFSIITIMDSIVMGIIVIMDIMIIIVIINYGNYNNYRNYRAEKNRYMYLPPY